MKNFKKVIFALSVIALVFGTITSIKISKNDFDNFQKELDIFQKELAKIKNVNKYLNLQDKLDMLENTRNYMFNLSYNKNRNLELCYSGNVDNNKIYIVQGNLLIHSENNDVKYVTVFRADGAYTYEESVYYDKIYTIGQIPLYHFIENDVKYMMKKRGGEWYKYRESDDIDHFTMETQNLLKKDNFVYDNDKEKIVLKNDYQCLNENIKITNLKVVAVEDNLKFEYEIETELKTFKVVLIIKDIDNVKVDLPKVDVDKSNEILESKELIEIYT